jgi:Na+-translocating ferredoxin:NAD+ oxidoreductase subunit B
LLFLEHKIPKEAAMDFKDSPYRALQQHLDGSPVGFPATESGADIRILQHLFTEKEARIAVTLSTFKADPAGVIYRRLRKSGISLTLPELQESLSVMLRKGTILVYADNDSRKLYKNAGVTAGGMYDFQVNRLTPVLMADFKRYHSEAFAVAETTGRVKIPQLRTIPVEKSITPPDRLTATYDNVRRLIENAPGPLAVVNCICRQTKDLQDQGCKYTSLRETCLQIGPDHARQYVEMGIARFIEKTEAFNILEKARQDGLILQPENSQNPEAICCCCGDCCALLSAVKKSPRPADLYATNFLAAVDPALCTACGNCLDRCQLAAVSIVEGAARVDPARCIGCGNCVSTCPAQALCLQHKEPERVPPRDKDTMYMQIFSRKKGRWQVFKLRLKMLAGMKVP